MNLRMHVSIHPIRQTNLPSHVYLRLVQAATEKKKKYKMPSDRGYTNTQVYLDARGTLTKILGVALPPAGLSGPQCGNGPRAELHPRLAEGCSKLK